jgi:SAM-dependent methyltransferase
MQVAHYSDAVEWYDVLKNRPYDQKMVDFLHNEVFVGRKSKTILDVACGTGSPSVGLGLMGYRVTCSDLDQRMLKIAMQKAAAMKADVGFVESSVDWRELSKHMRSEFDCVIVVGNSFYHLEKDTDKLLALRSFYDVLRPGGVCVIDFLKWDVEYNRIGQTEYESHGERILNDSVVGIFRVYKHHGRKQVDTFFVARIESDAPVEVVAVFQATGWAFSAEEIGWWARNAGFTNVEFCDRPGRHTPSSVMIATK